MFVINTGSSYFQREFPTLGEDDVNPEANAKEKDPSEEGGQNANPQATGHPTMMSKMFCSFRGWFSYSWKCCFFFHKKRGRVDSDNFISLFVVIEV